MFFISAIRHCRSIWLLALSLIAIAPAYAAGDLHDLYDALQTKGHAVAIPATLLGRLKLGSPTADIQGKEIVVPGRDRRGITSFELSGVPTLTMFHIEPDRDDAWLIRFGLDGRILKQEWEQGGYRTYEIQSAQVAEQEIDFWRRRLSGAGKP